MAENGVEWHASTKQTRFIAALVSSGNAQAAGDSCGVPERTFRRWLGDERFQAALQDAEDDLIESAARQVLGLTGQAVTEISNILSGRHPAGLKLRAAVSVIDTASKLLALRRIETRLLELERKQDLRIQVVYDRDDFFDPAGADA